ncbi:unnamed protein product [Mycena citricolor]|uniref:Elongation factor 1 alpha-like protein n=1 Tax=Mycena citricolor TaxID=2018698 RepID=A0AAD2HFZ3_9AGAR|nr:unnamed protein product [Mycena citricolor]
MVARHRNFQNMDYDTLLNDGLDRVRDTIGNLAQSGLTDAWIKDVLWDCNFEVEETVHFAIEEIEKNRLAQERKASMKDLPPLPPGENDETTSRELGYGEYSPPVFNQRGSIEEETTPRERRTNLPLIVLAQQKYGGGGVIEEEEEHSSGPVKRILSTISEKTERTEVLSPLWAPGNIDHPRLSLHTLNRVSSSVATSYGEAVDPEETTFGSLDPDLIPPSPSGSALHRLSIYEPAPSLPPSEADSMESSALFGSRRHAPSEPVPPLDTIPDIPDMNSKSSRPVTVSASQPAKKSKLAQLASSRASSSKSARSESSHTSTPEDVESVKTYPNLRPTSQSIRPLSTALTTSSSMSAHVRRAIATALEFEAVEQEDGATVKSAVTAKSGATGKSGTSVKSSATAKSGSTIRPVPPPAPIASNSSSPSQKPQSKLALLAQANKAARAAATAGKHQIVPTTQPTWKGPVLPEEHTEYLTPIANGSSVTTAITTSYQSLYSLTDPARQPMTKAPFVAPLPNPGTEIPKPSKLAMKMKKNQEKPVPQPAIAEPPPPPVSPIFSPKRTRSHGTPSAFGALLVDEQEPAKRRSKAKTRSGPRHTAQKIPDLFALAGDVSAFDGPSPDDIVLNARRDTLTRFFLIVVVLRSANLFVVRTIDAKEREKAQKQAAAAARPAPATPGKKTLATKANARPTASGSSTPKSKAPVDQRELDLSGLNLLTKEEYKTEPAPKVSFARDKLLEQAALAIEEQEKGKKALSLVVIGHVDAGKSTLMGRLLYESGKMDEKTKTANERNSGKAGKSSFSWAWGLDGTTEERERGITMDIAVQSFSTPHRQITVLDAPGHKEFVPNMISGAAQADCALLVVDASTGEFEAGFERGGQTREHLILARSLGVAQVTVAVNKLDQVEWSRDRFEEICGILKPFLVQSGFHPSKTSFVPVAAMMGVNLVTCDQKEAQGLIQWYKGPTLFDLLDKLEPPKRDLTTPVRIPVANIFKGQGSGISVSGRLLSGVVQVGERLRIMPGDESGVIKTIQVEEETVPWAVAGSNVTLALVNVDPIHLTIGSVLCPPTDPIPLATTFTAKVIIFDITVPIITGAMVELFHHSHDVPATVSKLIATLDRVSGKVIKAGPRVLSKTSSAEVQITLRAPARPIPLEPYAVNKAMGRILIRREAETIAAGVVVDILG